MATLNHQIILAARPQGLPKPSDFRIVETPVPEPSDGQFLVKTSYLSVDPYMRGRISEAKSFIGLFHGENLGKQLVRVST